MIELANEIQVPVYEEVADYTVDVDGKTPSEIADEIIAILESVERGQG